MHFKPKEVVSMGVPAEDRMFGVLNLSLFKDGEFGSQPVKRNISESQAGPRLPAFLSLLKPWELNRKRDADPALLAPHFLPALLSLSISLSGLS